MHLSLSWDITSKGRGVSKKKGCESLTSQVREGMLTVCRTKTLSASIWHDNCGEEKPKTLSSLKAKPPHKDLLAEYPSNGTQPSQKECKSNSRQSSSQRVHAEICPLAEYLSWTKLGSEYPFRKRLAVCRCQKWHAEREALISLEKFFWMQIKQLIVV